MGRVWAEAAGVALGLLLVLQLVPYWSKAVLVAPILLALAAVPSTLFRLWRRAEGPRLVQRTSGAAVLVALAAVLVDALPAERLFLGPRSTVLAVYLTLCGLLAVRAVLLPARGLPVARSVVASLLAAGLVIGQIHGHLAGPGGPGAVTIASPLSGEWFATQAGRNPATNGHRLNVGQAFAVDLVQVVDGKSYRGPKDGLTSYAAYDEPVIAPAAGRVVRAVGNLPDSKIGDRDIANAAGNEVVIEVRPGAYVLLAHLKAGSVAVKVGQSVEPGDPIGRVGNSGNSSEPHLHLQAMTTPSAFDRGTRSLPLLLTGVVHVRGGRETSGQPVELRRNDRFRS